MKKAYRVNEYEFERGYGRRHEGTYWFKTKEEAEAWCKRYNSKNVGTLAPDTYWVCIYEGEHELPEEKDYTISK